MSRYSGTDRLISRLFTETLHNVRQEMEDAGRTVHHYEGPVDTPASDLHETIVFADGLRVDVFVDEARQSVLADVHTRSESLSAVQVGFDGSRRVWKAGEAWRDMTAEENAEWDRRRRARRAQRVKPFSTTEVA